MKPAVVLAALLLASALAPVVSGDQALGVVVTPRPFAPTSVDLRTYPVLDEDRSQVGSAQWRIVRGTGNGNENAIAITLSGRLLDAGAGAVRYSDDRGVTWRTVAPAAPTLGAEGSIAVAPNGDVLAMTWDPYTGDRVATWKYDAALDRWYASEATLHGPFYDRPWLAVLPGPFDVAGTTVPYLGMMKGGVVKGPRSMSFDGLTYATLRLPHYDGHLGDAANWVDGPSAAWADVVQPISPAGVMTLHEGAIVLHAEGPAPGARCLLMQITRDTTWRCAKDGEGNVWPYDEMVRDSRGRIHGIAPYGNTVVYGMSADGGRTWRSETLTLPTGWLIEDHDFKANGAADMAAVAIHAHDKTRNVDVDLVWKLSDLSSPAWTLREMRVGGGDRNFGGSFGSSIQRFDFVTMALFPDGKIAVTFADAANARSTLAIET